MSSGKGGRKFTGPPPTTRSNKKAKLEHSTTSVNSRALDTTTTAAGENLWTDIDNRLFGTAADESQVFDSLQSFFKLLSKVSPIDESQVQKIAEASPLTPSDGGGLSAAISIDENLTFHVNLSPENECEIFLKSNGQNKFLLPTIGDVFDILGDYVGDSSALDLMLPGIFADIGSGLSIDGLTFSFSSHASPSLSFGISLEFDANSVLAKNIGLKEILLKVDLTTTPNCTLLNSYLEISLGEIRIGAVLPTSPDDLWSFTLVPSENKVTFGTLLRTVQLGDLTNTGIYSLTDSGDSPFITELSIGISNSTGIESFYFSVESTFSAEVGTVIFSKPMAFLNITSPFDAANRGTHLGLYFEIQIGSSLEPIICGGLLSYSGGKEGGLTGSISAHIVGTVQVEDIFDLSEAGDDVKLSIEELDLELDIGKVGVSNSSFVFIYGEKPSFTLSWEGMKIEVGGTKKLDLHLSVPVGDLTANLISYVHVEYIKDDPDNNGKSTKRFSTDIQVHDNLIEDGLALLGDAGDSIIEKKELTLAIEKTGRKTLFLMPDGLIPDPIRLGGADGLVLSNARGFVKPGKRLAFGAGGSLELNMLGFSTVLEGELSVQRRGIVGRMGYRGEIAIGKHVKLTSFFVEFAVGQAGGETTFTLYEKEGNLKLIMAMLPGAPPVPYPTSFDLTYPEELSIKGLIEAFVGEVPIPSEIGEIVVISGTPDETTLVKGDLKIEFDIVAIYFKIDCFISVLDGFFEGSVKGEFSVENGLDFHAKLKPINLVFLKIDGYNPGEQPELKLVIPGISSSPTDLEVYVNGSVTVLGITQGVRIEFDNQGVRFQVKGNMWDVLKAELSIYGDVSDGGASLGIDATFENSIIETITENSHQFVNNLLDGALNGLNSAQQELARKQEELKKLDVERTALIKRIKKEKEAAKKSLDAAQAVVDRARETVASLEKDINRQRAIVKAERDYLLKDIEAAKKSLRDARRALSSIDRQIEDRTRELNRQRKKLNDEIKRLENSISSAQRTVNSWQNSVRWHEGEISRFHRKVSSKYRAISNLSWWKSWKAAIYLAEISAFYVRIGTLEVGKASVIASRVIAIKVLSGIKSSINWSRRKLNQIPAALLDLTIIYLVGKREVSKLALDAAIAFLNGTGNVIEWVPIDVDPRVAGIIILKAAADTALTVAYESLNLLKGAIDLFPPEMDPRVLALDAKKVIANTVLEVAQGILATAAAAVSGPMAEALNFIADGVNGILKSIPLVINTIEFSSHLSTASGGAVELKMTYTFLGNKKSLQFMFDFSRATDVLVQFAEEIGNEILALVTGGNKSRSLMMDSATDVGHNFSMDELNNVDIELKNLRQDLKVEGNQAALEFEYAKVEMKTALVEAQEGMLGLRLAFVDEQKHTGEEDKEILTRINTIVSDDIGTEVKMRSRGLGATRSQVDEASAGISEILIQLEAECEKERASVETFGATLQATREALRKELEDENQDRARSFDMYSSNEESQKEAENTIKRKRIALWEKHERSLRKVVQADRAEKRDRVVQRTKLYEESTKNLETMKDFSAQLIEDINSLSNDAAAIAIQKNNTKSRGVSHSAGFGVMGESADPEEIVASVLDEEDEEEKLILDKRDTMIVKMAMYQHSLEGGADSVHKKSQYDMALLQVFKMEDQLMSVLDGLDDDKGYMEYSISAASE